MKLCIGLNESLKKIGGNWRSLSMEGTPDIKDDARILKEIENESCEEILASAVLEHLDYRGWGSKRVEKTIVILKLWYSKLIMGGKIYITVPDLDVVIEVLTKYRERYWEIRETVYKDIIGCLYGAGQNQYNFHSMVYNYPCLKHCLKQAGFTNIRKVKPEDISSEVLKYNVDAFDIRALSVGAEKSKRREENGNS